MLFNTLAITTGVCSAFLIIYTDVAQAANTRACTTECYLSKKATRPGLTLTFEGARTQTEQMESSLLYLRYLNLIIQAKNY